MIEFNDVYKSWDNHSLFNGLTFEMGMGEAVGLLGKSGIGKTTILKMAAGVIGPDSGTVMVESPRIGYIFQEPRLIPWKTALENICFGLKTVGLGSSESKEIGMKYIAKLDLEGFENHYPAQLSGGMQQRVSIGRAFAIDPEILLMDEPFGGLDLGLKDTMRGIVQDMLTRKSPSLLYVTHDPEEVSGLVTRLLLLHEGGRLQELPMNSHTSCKGTLRKKFCRNTDEAQETQCIGVGRHSQFKN